MRSLSFRTVLATAVAAVTCLALTPTPYAADVTVRPFQRFVAKAPFDGDPGAPSRVDIVIQRWSTDSECSDLGGALTARGPEGLLPGLHALRLRAGAVLIPGGPNAGARALTRRSVNLFFAHEIETPTGRQLIVASDHPLDFGQPTVSWSPEVAFSLLEIRFAADGVGIGKVAPAVNVAFNENTNTVEATNFDVLPVRLIEVKPAKL